jgi:membrane-bound lytic murein transglycosylase D
MSLRLRMAVLAALAMAGACPAAEPEPVAATPEPVASSASAGSVATPEPATAAPPLLAPLLSPTPATGPLISPLAPPPAVEIPRANEVVEEPGPPAALAGTPAMRSGQEVFARLRRGLAPNACYAGSNSARWRGRYAASPVTFSRRVQGALPLIDFVSAEVERAGLPAEFAFIPLVESWYQPGAIGANGPAGMWQMIGSTARNHGIHIRAGYDGRLSPVESTRAALSYLKVLRDMFGDWQAIVMAYNAGEGRVQNAMRRAGNRTANAAQRKPHGLSNITYDYVDKLQALSCLVLQPERHKVQLPMAARFEPLVPVLMDEQVRSLEQFAAAHGKDAVLLRKLNPGFRDGRVVAGVPRLVLSPGASQAPIVATVPPAQMLAGNDADATTLAATTASAAAAGPEAAVEATPAPAMLPVSLPPASDSAPQPPVAQDAPNPDPPEPVHEVRAGDTLNSIATHYQLPLEQILRANKLDREARLRPGQRLRLVP